MTGNFDAQWKTQLQRLCEARPAGKMMERLSSVPSEFGTPPPSPSLETTLQDLMQEKTKAEMERQRLSQSPQMLFAHKDIPLSRVNKLEGTIDRLIQIQSQQPSPNSTFSQIDGKPSEDEFGRASDERTVEYKPKPCLKQKKPVTEDRSSQNRPCPSRETSLIEENRRLESQLSESQRKIQELVAKISDLQESQDVIQSEMQLTIKTLEQCRDFKVSCGKYVKDLERELTRLRKEMRISRSLPFEDILRSFAERIEMLEDGSAPSCTKDQETEGKLRELEIAMQKLVQERKQTNDKMKDSGKRLSQVNGEKQALEATNKELETVQKQHEGEIRALKQQVKSLQSQVDSHQNDQEAILSLTAELSRLNSELQKASIRCQKAELLLEEREREPVQEKPASTPQDAQVAYLLSRKENEELVRDIKRLQASQDTLHAQITKANEDLRTEKTKREALEAANIDLTAKKTDADKLRIQLKKEESVRKRVEAELHDLKSQASSETSKQSTEFESLTSSLKSCKLQLKRANDKLQHVQTLREQLQDSLTAATNQVTQLQEQATKNIEAVRDTDRALTKAERRIGELEASVAEYQSKAQEYELNLTAAKARETELKDEIHTQCEELAKLRKPDPEPDSPGDRIPVQDKAVKVPTKESLELRVYFESWLESLPAGSSQ